MAQVTAVVYFKRMQNGLVVDDHICLHGIENSSDYGTDEYGFTGHRVSGSMKDEGERRFQEYIATQGYKLVGGHRGEFISGGIP